MNFQFRSKQNCKWLESRQQTQKSTLNDQSRRQQWNFEIKYLLLKHFDRFNVNVASAALTSVASAQCCCPATGSPADGHHQIDLQ